MVVAVVVVDVVAVDVGGDGGAGRAFVIAQAAVAERN